MSLVIIQVMQVMQVMQIMEYYVKPGVVLPAVRNGDAPPCLSVNDANGIDRHDALG